MTTAEKAEKVVAKKNFDDLSLETRDAIAELKNRAVVTDTGITYKPGAFKELLEKDGLTEEAYVQIQEFDAKIHRAGAYVQGELGVPILKANPEMTHVVTELKTFGKDKISFGLKRESPFTIRDGEGAVTGTGTNYGSVSVDHKSYSTKKRGEMTTISAIISDLAEAQLKTK